MRGKKVTVYFVQKKKGTGFPTSLAKELGYFFSLSCIRLVYFRQYELLRVGTLK